MKTLIKFTLIQLLLFQTLLSFGQSSWLWANQSGSPESDRSRELAIDAMGNVYCETWTLFSDECHFNTQTFQILGHNDYFITKYDPQGNEIWTMQIGGNNWSTMYFKLEYLNTLSYDPTSNCIFVYGDYVRSINLGNVTLNTGAWDSQVYLAKLDLDGNCIWARQAGCQSDNDDDQTCFATIDNIGNAYICAYFPYNANFGSLSVGYGFFLAKYDVNGNLVWAKKIMDISAPGGWGQAFFSGGKVIDGNLYILGNNWGDTFTIDTITITNPGYNGYFLAKFDTTGNINWVKQFAGPDNGASCQTIINDSQNNLYITGSFNGGYGTFGADTLYSNANTEMYIMKCDLEGNNIWLKQSNATSKAYALGMTGFKDGKFYIVGGFNQNIHFGNILLETQLSKEMFLACFDNNGNCINAVQAGQAVGYGIEVDNSGELYVCGDIFGPTVFGDTILSGFGDADMFVAKHDQIAYPNKIENKAKENNKLLIYANPNEGRCTISIPEELQNEKTLYLLVYNNTGKLIHRETIDLQAERISINLEAFAKGIYNAVLTNGKITYEGKIVFE